MYLDGEIQETIPLHALSDWNTWGSSELGATMVSAGTHTLRISFVDYAVNIDALTVEDKHESIRSLYLSNWKNMMAIWNDTKLCSEDTPEAGLFERFDSHQIGIKTKSKITLDSFMITPRIRSTHQPLSSMVKDISQKMVRSEQTT